MLYITRDKENQNESVGLFAILWYNYNRYHHMPDISCVSASGAYGLLSLSVTVYITIVGVVVVLT